MQQSTFFPLYLIVICFNLMFALSASSIAFSGCDSKERKLYTLKNVILACFQNLDECVDGKIVSKGKFLLYSKTS